MTLSGLAFSDSDWTFYANQKDSSLFLTNSVSRMEGCEGKKAAGEFKKALDKWILLRKLCYEVDSKGFVLFKDPKKYVWNTFSVNSSDFIKIPSRLDEELDAMQRSAQARARSLQNGIQLLEINGDLKTCIRIGAILDCA